MSSKVFVGNLSFRTRENDLAHEFEQVGKVLTANIITRGPRSLGYGFVEFETPELAQKSVDVMNHKEIDGRPINVEVAKARDPNGPAPVAAAAGAPPVRRFRGPPLGFRPFAPVVGMMPPPRGPRRDFMPPQMMAYPPPQAMGFNRPPRRPRPPRQDNNKLPEPSKTTLFVANLPFVVEEDTLREIFAEFNVKEAHVVKRPNGRSKGYGFVELATEDDQRRALQTLDKIEIEGRDIIIKPAMSTPAGVVYEPPQAAAQAPAAAPVKAEVKEEKKDAAPAPAPAAAPAAAPAPAEKQAPK